MPTPAGTPAPDDAASDPVRVGVLGARSFIATRALLPALDACPDTLVVATSAVTGPVGAGLADPRLAAATAAVDVGTYAAVIADPRVEVVYVPLANDQHRPWVERALDAGKHVLCEKPLGVDADDAAAMLDAADRAGLLLAEAWMTPFSPRWAAAIDAARAGAIGDVRHVRTTFTFPIGPEAHANHRLDPARGGGAFLDVGIYALGPSVALWGVEPAGVAAVVDRAPSGVDRTVAALLDHGDGRTASVLVSFALPERQELELVGTGGRIVVDVEAHTNAPGSPPPRLETPDGARPLAHADADSYVAMVGALAAAVRGRAPWPRSGADVLAMARLVDRVRAAGGAGSRAAS